MRFMKGRSSVEAEWKSTDHSSDAPNGLALGDASSRLTFHDFDSLSFRMIQSIVVTSRDHGPKDSVDDIAKEQSLTRLTTQCSQALKSSNVQ